MNQKMNATMTKALTHALLEPEDEKRLARRAYRGDKKARDEMVVRNLRFVAWVARESYEIQLPLEDRIAAGWTGLIRAAEKFDPDKGVKFMTYAVWWIRQAIQKAGSDGTIRIPQNVIRDRMRLQNGREDELTPSQKEQVKTAAKAMYVKSLDDPEHRALCNLPDDIPAPDEQALENDACDHIAAAIEVLPPRTADIIRRHYGIDPYTPQSYQVIGDAHDISRERVRQVLEGAYRQLRRNKALARL
jgi:RNA polymerase primary sigma factor